MARYLGVAEESSFGTPVTVDKYIDIVREGIVSSPDARFRRTVRGRPTFKHGAGLYSIAGPFDMFVEPENHFGWLLKWALGDVTSELQGTTAYLHTFKGADTIKPFTCGICWDAINEKQIAGAILDVLTIEAVKGQALTATASILGKTEALISVATPSFSDLDAFEHYHADPKIENVSQTIVEAFRVTIANNVYPVSDIGVLGDRFLPRIELRERVVTGSMDLAFENADEYKRFLGDAVATAPTEPLGTVDLECEFDTGILIETTYNYLFDIEMPKCVYTAGDVHIVEQERKVLRIDFQAEYDSTLASEIAVKLQNTVTSYPDAT